VPGPGSPSARKIQDMLAGMLSAILGSRGTIYAVRDAVGRLVGRLATRGMGEAAGRLGIERLLSERLLAALGTETNRASISSAAGRLAFPMRTPYSFAKFGVVGFTESLAAEAGPDGVRVNCIQPGVVEGERIERVISAKAKQLGMSFEQVRSKMLEGVSMHTTVTAQDIANTALFLATEPGKHISGQAISVCGGARYLV